MRKCNPFLAVENLEDPSDPPREDIESPTFNRVLYFDEDDFDEEQILSEES